MITRIEGETGTQRTLGYRIEIGHEDGGARCHLDVTDAHTNRHNVLHGGIALTLLDNAMGVTASLTVDPTGRTPFLTISLTSQFKAPALPGMRLTALGRVTGGGRSILFLDSRLTAEDGTEIASATGVYKRVSLPKDGDA